METSARDAQRSLQSALGDRYSIERELGRGGMATVYLATDLRHHRYVAVKVLHPGLAAALGQERFLREIEVTASLQHPHILPLFDSGAANGLLFYVMPYVEGESLRARLARERQLPVADAVRLACEVADALSYAHARGVIHRDVKPENILLQGAPTAHALVADFGIALAAEQAAGERLTQSGFSLGTPQYMSPEQAMGERGVDARADVYALGTVLYEMLAGEPPFTGPSTQAVIARAMTESPRPLAAQRPSVPPHVDAAVARALETLPADRFDGAAAFAAALSNPDVTATTRAVRVAEPASHRWRVRVPQLLGVVAAIAALGVAVTWARARSVASDVTTVPATGPIRLTIEPDSAVPRFGSVAISPDGRTVVYAGYGPAGELLYARRLDDIEAHPLTGTENGELPFFSPDGAWVAFVSNGTLRRTRLSGGTPIVIAAMPSPLDFDGGTWGADDVILYALGPHGGVWRVPAKGGASTRLPFSDASLNLSTPSLLPNGRSALFTTSRDGISSSIGLMDLATGRLRVLGPGGGARWVKGSLVWVGNGGELYRQRFDLSSQEATGAPVQIANGLDASTVTLSVSTLVFDASASGALVYRMGASTGVEGTLQLIVTDHAGRRQRTIAARVPWTPRFAPDGRHLAYGAFAPGHDSSDVWITDVADGATERLTTDARDNNDPAWSADGSMIAYSTVTTDGRQFMLRALRGGEPRRLGDTTRFKAPSDWDRHLGVLLYTNKEPSGETDVWMQPVDGGPPRPYATGPGRQAAARVSPDGTLATYESNETGRNEVYVRSFPMPGRATPLSSDGGANPIWSPDGSRVYYWHVDQLIAVRVERARDSTLAVRGRDTLFRAPYFENFHAMYDASRDGRFAIVTGGARAGRLVVALGTLRAEH